MGTLYVCAAFGIINDCSVTALIHRVVKKKPIALANLSSQLVTLNVQENNPFFEHQLSSFWLLFMLYCNLLDCFSNILCSFTIYTMSQ